MPTFPKQEKLCGQLRIAALYKEGRRFVAFPLRVTIKKSAGTGAENPLCKVLIWAPKSLFKHAVDRNHLRRLIREAYRLEKEPLEAYCETQPCTIELAFNYMDKEVHDFETIRRAVRKAIKKITNEPVAPIDNPAL